MPHLMCVLIESKDGSIRFVATDRHRLSVRDVVPSESGAFRAVVAADTIREWVTVLDEKTSASKDLLVLQRRDHVIEVTASCDGPVAHVALDPSYGADALRSAVGVETVVEIADPLEPVIFRSADDGTFTSLLMPVKLD